jgi:hypothetical protein
MRKAKHILSAILMVALLSSGLPLFNPEDANRDSRVDLEDVILNVRDFAQSTEKPAAFTSNVKKVLSTLHVVAGLKTYFKPAKDTKSTNSISAIDLSYLIPSTNPLILPNRCSVLPEQCVHYTSILLEPTSPPPRAA